MTDNPSSRTHWEVEKRLSNGVWFTTGLKFQADELEILERNFEASDWTYRIIEVTTITERKVIKDTSV